MRITTWVARAICLLYLIALTTLLLVPNPLAWLWGIAPNISPPHRGVHFCTFFLLAILCAASRLPWKPATLGIVLIAYALTTESLQGLVDNRVVELIDYTENLLGLAVGAIVWRLGWRIFGRRHDDGPTLEN